MVGFILLWFLNEIIKFYMILFIGLIILSGVFIFNRLIRDFVLFKVKIIDLYIILFVLFIFFNYFLYIDERLDL